MEETRKQRIERELRQEGEAWIYLYAAGGEMSPRTQQQEKTELAANFRKYGDNISKVIPYPDLREIAGVLTEIRDCLYTGSEKISSATLAEVPEIREKTLDEAISKIDAILEDTSPFSLRNQLESARKSRMPLSRQ